MGRSAAGNPPLRTARGAGLGRGRPRCDPRARRGRARGYAARIRARAEPGGRGSSSARRGRDAEGSRRSGPRHVRVGPVTGEQVAQFEEVIEGGGLAIFPTDTVYGLGTHPDSVEGVHRLYWIKGRSPDRPAAVLFFDLERALAEIPEIGVKTQAALDRLLPGPVTLLLPNPTTHFPLACGAEPNRLGVRVPKLDAKLARLADVKVPILQSSANPTGDPDPRSLEEVDGRIRKGADVELDAGVLAGTPSTVIDLCDYEDSGSFELLREGALSAEAVGAAL